MIESSRTGEGELIPPLNTGLTPVRDVITQENGNGENFRVNGQALRIARGA